MSKFLHEIVTWNKFELLIDTKIFPKDIVLKAAYNFLDKWYFFFRFDENQNVILEFTKKQDIDTDPKIVIWEFSDELLDVYLRDALEKDNKVIRETIVTKAINGPIDMKNFVSLDTDVSLQNEIDFDKDIDEILKEIESDPEVNIDEDEIEKILKEIDDEVSSEVEKPSITVSRDSVSSLKNMFKKK